MPIISTPSSATVIELDWKFSPFEALGRIPDRERCLLLESSMRHSTLGRYSFLMADPIEWWQPDQASLKDTFDWLDDRLDRYACSTLPDLPPFQGGVAGLLGYEFGGAIESIAGPPISTDVPTVALGVYDVVVAWDHQQNRQWIISRGTPETRPDRQQKRARSRAHQFLDWLKSNGQSETAEARSEIGKPVSVELDALTSNFDREAYLDMVQSALDHIHAGDIFQVNLAQQLTHPATSSSLQLYRQLRTHNPSTFSGLFDLGNCQVISTSPERLVSIRDRRVETRPIKGTRKRTRYPEVDIEIGNQLLTSTKDRAENIMIVDLMRNDFSRICDDSSVIVTQLAELERYASVLHLVSAVTGQLRPDVSMSEVVRAVFPGGSITGAPKIRAMEIIGELEQVARGPYCGSLGYFGFDGSGDWNILIRTITARDNQWIIPVGGGVVADSQPAEEYEETWIKASSMLAAVGASSDQSLRFQP